jgi:hypothetical protein
MEARSFFGDLDNWFSESGSFAVLGRFDSCFQVRGFCDMNDNDNDNVSLMKPSFTGLRGEDLEIGCVGFAARRGAVVGGARGRLSPLITAVPAAAEGAGCMRLQEGAGGCRGVCRK